MKHTGAVVLEAWRSASSQPVASLLTLALVAGVCVAALLTTGRTAAAEEAALKQIDNAGTRSVVVRASTEAGLDPAIGEKISAVADVEEVAVFGPVFDARNGRVDGAPPVGVREVYSGLALLPPRSIAHEVRAYASPNGAAALGLVDGTGDVVSDDGRHLTVTGSVAVPDHLGFLEPFVVVPQRDPVQPAALVVVLVREPYMVETVADAIAGMLGVTDPRQVTFETSESLANVRAAVSGQLGEFGRQTVLGILAIALVLVAANMFGLVAMRRKDFGRRRALGASRVLIVVLLMTQVGLLAAVGGAVGTLGTLAAFAVGGDSLPGADFWFAIYVAAVLTAVVSAVAPAIGAARREPLHELRIP